MDQEAVIVLGASLQLPLLGPELAEFVEPVRHLAQQSKQVHAMFNNCYQDNAQVNARQFMKLLGD